jgi:hypothetical protein
MGIVTSNAWLDANYGYELQKFFLRYFKVIAVLESRCEPWFTEASVNTIVTIVERCDSLSERGKHMVKFVKVKKPLADLLPGDPGIDAPTRWSKLRDLVVHIDEAGRKYVKTQPIGMITEEDENFRIRILRQSEMLAELKAADKTVKWGRYLRAPQVYFDILKNGNVCLLGETSVPLRGGMTRINEFFHVTPSTAEQFGIEDEYLLRFIKGPKDTNTIRVDPNDLTLRVFVCGRSKADLRRLGHRGALKYISWGEEQTYGHGAFKGMKWPDGVWVKGRKPGWWALPSNELQLAQVFFSGAFGDRHIHRYSPSPLVADKRLYFLAPDSRMTAEELAAALNSSVASLALEATGRLTMGGGALELTVEDAREYFHVPDLRSLTVTSRESLGTSFRPLLDRSIQPVLDEVKREDRRRLDTEVLHAIGLDLKPIYEGLSELVRERIELRQMRGKARTTKDRGAKAEKKVAEEVLDEVIPDGPRRFPEDFFSNSASGGDRTSVELPEAQLIFDRSPLFTGIHTADGTYSSSVKSPAEAKFLLYAQRSGHRAADLPDQTVEVSRTVANYEKYLRELRKQLYETYYRRTLDSRTAARLTEAAFDRFHLPNVDG